MGSIRKRDDNGLLFFDFRHLGKRCREQTTLQDTPSNCKKLEKILERIEADIKFGTFDYARSFPGSKNIAKFATGLPVTPAPIAAAVAQAVNGAPVSVATVNGHLRSIFLDGELEANRTIRKFRIVATEATRSVERLVDHYNLEAIFQVGYRRLPGALASWCPVPALGDGHAQGLSGQRLRAR